MKCKLVLIFSKLSISAAGKRKSPQEEPISKYFQQKNKNPVELEKIQETKENNEYSYKIPLIESKPVSPKH